MTSSFKCYLGKRCLSRNRTGTGQCTTQQKLHKRSAAFDRLETYLNVLFINHFQARLASDTFAITYARPKEMSEVYRQNIVGADLGNKTTSTSTGDFANYLKLVEQ